MDASNHPDSKLSRIHASIKAADRRSKLTEILNAVDSRRMVLSWREEQVIIEAATGGERHPDLYDCDLTVEAIYQNHIDQILCL